MMATAEDQTLTVSDCNQNLEPKNIATLRQSAAHGTRTNDFSNIQLCTSLGAGMYTVDLFEYAQIQTYITVNLEYNHLNKHGGKTSGLKGKPSTQFRLQF